MALVDAKKIHKIHKKSKQFKFRTPREAKVAEINPTTTAKKSRTNKNVETKNLSN